MSLSVFRYRLTRSVHVMRPGAVMGSRKVLDSIYRHCMVIIDSVVCFYSRFSSDTPDFSAFSAGGKECAMR